MFNHFFLNFSFNSHLLSFCFFFFFLMIRRPPRSTLFPYHDALPILFFGFYLGETYHLVGERNKAVEIYKRSEEHTSELQSPTNLVCRLLLEIKKSGRRDMVIIAEEGSAHTEGSGYCEK